MDEKAMRTLLYVLSLMLALALLLFLMQSAASRESARVFDVSVIVPGSGEAFAKGLDKASRDHSVDVHVASAGALDAAAQTEQLRREIENGVDAIVLEPVDDTVADWLSKQKTAIPVICIGETRRAERFAAGVTEDNEAIGRLLGEAAARAAEAGGAVAVFCTPGKLAADMWYEALTDALVSAGVPFTSYLADGSLESYLDSDPAASILIGLDPDVTKRLVENAAADDRVFGVGTDSESLYQCASGRIEALAVWSDYELAYLGLSAAVKAASGEKTESVTVQSYLADGRNLFAEPLARILFPAS